MKHNKSSKSKHERKKNKKKYKKEKRKESSSSSSNSETEQEWVEKSPSKSVEQSASSSSKVQEPTNREDWMNMKSIFPCVFNEKRSTSYNANKNADKNIDLDKLGQSDRELNSYWKNGGNGLPSTGSMETDSKQVMDANWLRKSLRRAQEQAEEEGKSLEEIAANRWGSLEVIKSMIFKAEQMSCNNRSKNICNTEKSNCEAPLQNREKYGSSKRLSYPTESRKDKLFRRRSRSRSRSQERYKRYREHTEFEKSKKQKYKRPTVNVCFTNDSHKTSSNYSSLKRWQKGETSNKTKEAGFNSNISEEKETIVIEENSNANDMESNQTKPMTEAEMNKLGAKIVKAEIMGNIDLAMKLKVQLQNARELSTKAVESSKMENVQNVILTHTDKKGVARPLESRSQFTALSASSKQKNQQTHVSGKRVRYYFDDDKYSLNELFQREKGRSTKENDAAFVKVASKNINMDELFEEQITSVQSDMRQDDIERSVAIKEHKQLSKNLDSCRWCIDSKYMLKHMVIEMDSEICLSLPHCTSLIDGHCILTPVQHVACQLQLDENVWEKLKIYKRTLYKVFEDQNKYPVFYEIYNSRRKFPHMQLECVPLPKNISELTPMYFKKALLECETEWSMNKKIVDLERKNIRQAIPNGLSYFMVEFENKGYAHVIEDEQLFPKNFAEEIIGGMLDLDCNVWRNPKKENFDQQREKVLQFLEMWKKYDFGVTNHN